MFKLLDISEIKGSTHTYTDQQKGTKKVTWTIYRSKKCWKVGIELSINDNTKIPQIYTLPQFLSMSEKIVEFTDSTHIIY